MESVSFCSDYDRPVAQARGGADGRQEGRERGYYHLHRKLDDALLLHTPLSVSAAGVISAVALGLQARIVGLLEDHVLHQRLGHDVLLDDLVLLVLGLSDDHSLRLGLEEHPSRGDGLSAAVIFLVGSDAGESHLEDADAVEFHLLTEFEEVFHGASQFVEHGLDVTLLHARLRLDEVCQLLGLDEVMIVDCRCEPLAECRAVIVRVLNFLEFLTHCVSLSLFFMVLDSVCCDLHRVAASRLFRGER